MYPSRTGEHNFIPESSAQGIGYRGHTQTPCRTLYTGHYTSKPHPTQHLTLICLSARLTGCSPAYSRCLTCFWNFYVTTYFKFDPYLNPDLTVLSLTD